MGKMLPDCFRTFCLNNHRAIANRTKILAAPYSFLYGDIIPLFIFRNKHYFHRLIFVCFYFNTLFQNRQYLFPCFKQFFLTKL